MPRWVQVLQGRGDAFHFLTGQTKELGLTSSTQRLAWIDFERMTRLQIITQKDTKEVEELLKSVERVSASILSMGVKCCGPVC